MRGRYGAQCGSVACAPDEPFSKRGYQLAMPTRYCAIGAKVEQGIVKRTGAWRTLGDSYHRHDVMRAAGSRNDDRFGTRYRDGLLDKTLLKGGERLCAWTGRARRDAPYPVGVAGNARFREGN